MLIALLGESGSGKDAVQEKMIKDLDFKKIINYTSRPKRQDDKTDTYHYLTNDEFRNLIDQQYFIQYNFYLGEYYGLAAKDFAKIKDNDYVFITGKDGLKIIKQKLPQAVSIYLEVSENERYNRMKKRGDCEEKIQMRLEKDRKYFQDIEEYADVKINNEQSLQETIRQIDRVSLLDKSYSFNDSSDFILQINKMLKNLSKNYILNNKLVEGEMYI